MAKEVKVATVRGQRVTRVSNTEWTWLIDGVQFWWREAEGLNTLHKIPTEAAMPVAHSATLNDAVLWTGAFMNGWYAREGWDRRQQTKADARGG